MIQRYFIYIRWKGSCHFVSREWRTLILAFRCIIWTRLANVNIWVNSSSYHEATKISKSTPNIYPLYYIIRSTICLFVPCVLVWLHFCNETETSHSEIPARSTCHVSRERAVLDSIALRILISDCVKKNSISKLHVIGMPLNEQTISFFFLPYSSTHRRLVIPERVYNRDM